MNKWGVSKFSSWFFLLAAFLLIFPSGFRGDVGPDSYTYRVIYENVQQSASFTKLSEVHGFEPASSFFIMAHKKLGLDYESLQLSVMIMSLLCLLFVFLKADSLSFTVFLLLYFCFAYYQLQWSVIRNSLGFWLFCFFIVCTRSVNISAVVASLFHYSFAISLLRFKRLHLVLGGAVFLLALFYYSQKYSDLSRELLYSFFFGGWARLLYHGALALVIIVVLGFSKLRIRYLLRNQPLLLLFLIFFFFGMLFPLGWRLVVVAAPLVLVSDIRFITVRRLLVFVFLSLLVFVQKSYTFMSAELESTDYTVMNFIPDFYAGIFGI